MRFFFVFVMVMAELRALFLLLIWAWLAFADLELHYITIKKTSLKRETISRHSFLGLSSQAEQTVSVRVNKSSFSMELILREDFQITQAHSTVLGHFESWNICFEFFIALTSIRGKSLLMKGDKRSK